MTQKPPLCKLCDEPGIPRSGRPGTFIRLCVNHYAEYMKRKRRESYLRHKEQRVRESGERHDKAYRERPDVQAYQRVYQSAWRVANPEKIREYERRYIENNREKVNAKVQRRSQRKRTAVGSCSQEQWEARIDFYGHRCYLCGCDWDALPKGQKHQEHVIPISRGGSNWPANLRPACQPCNSRKH
jgi:5-methylcytosine-specific restriction endonuclease McrA